MKRILINIGKALAIGLIIAICIIIVMVIGCIILMCIPEPWRYIVCGIMIIAATAIPVYQTLNKQDNEPDNNRSN